MNRFLSAFTTKTPKARLLLGLITLLVIAVVIWAAVVKNSNQAAPAAITPPPVAKVLITEDGFQPATLKIKPGTVVIWTNKDTNLHRVAANPYGSHSSLPSLDSKSNIATNGTYRYEFKTSGTFNYHDELNPQVGGTIVVAK